MPRKKNLVRLIDGERQQLSIWSQSRHRSELERKRARILLLADANQEGGALPDIWIAQQVKADAQTVSRVRQRFAERGLLSVQRKEQDRRKPRLLDGVGEAHLIALTCSAPPAGHTRWSLHLLKNTLIEQQITDTISHETVRQTLKKTNLSPG